MGPTGYCDSIGTCHRARTGLDTRLIDAAHNIRTALDERIERAVLSGEIASDRQAKAFRLVRTFKLHKLKLLHLIDQDDIGTDISPLKSFKGNADQFSSKLLRVFSRLKRIMLMAHPSVSCACGDFYEKLADELTYAATEGCPLDVMSEFYRATIAKVVAPIRAFDVGSFSATSDKAHFETLFITGTSAARTTFDRAINKVGAQRAGAEASGKSPKRPGEHEPKIKSPKSPKLKGQETKGKEAHNKARAQHNKGAGKRDPSVSDGAAVPLEFKDKAKGQKALTTFVENHPDVSVNGVSGRQCWNYHHPQGCSRGAQCQFWHGSQ